MELIVLVILSLLLMPLVIFTSGALKVIFGLPFVLFFPGYTLIAALYPKKEGLGNVERLALSLGLSLALVPLIGLILNYTTLGVNLYPVLVSIIVFIIIMSAIAWFRRQRLLPEDRFQFRFISLKSFLSAFKKPQRWRDRLLNVFLAIAIIGAISTITYVVANPKPGEQLSDFYILGMEEESGDLPEGIMLGEEYLVILGIVNHEYKAVDYRVEITIDNEAIGIIGPNTLEHEEKLEQEVSITPLHSGPNQKVEFLLYKGDENSTYLSLYLWINVNEAE